MLITKGQLIIKAADAVSNQYVKLISDQAMLNEIQPMDTQSDSEKRLDKMYYKMLTKNQIHLNL